MTNLVLIGRHGRKDTHPDRKNDLSDVSISSLYDQGLEIGQKYVLPGMNIRGIRTYNSNLARTEATNKARLAGILGLSPIPLTQADVLTDSKFPNLALVPVNKRHGLSFFPEELSIPAYMRAETQEAGLGGKVCTNYGLNNLDARQHEGTEILPFGYVIAKSAGSALEAISNLGRNSNGERNLAMVTSHAVITDAAVAALIASGRGNNIGDLPKSVDEFGGAFKEEDYAVLDLSKSTREGKLFRGSKEWQVNILPFYDIVHALEAKYPVSLFTEAKR
ncbi:MAG: hypothetical protein AABW82_02850 [Nanoarchaeota archaeon]